MNVITTEYCQCFRDLTKLHKSCRAVPDSPVVHSMMLCNQHKCKRVIIYLKILLLFPSNTLQLIFEHWDSELRVSMHPSNLKTFDKDLCMCNLLSFTILDKKARRNLCFGQFALTMLWLFRISVEQSSSLPENWVTTVNRLLWWVTFHFTFYFVWQQKLKDMWIRTDLLGIQLH